MKRKDYEALGDMERQKIMNTWRRNPFGKGPLTEGIDDKAFLRWEDWLDKYKHKGGKK